MDEGSFTEDEVDRPDLGGRYRAVLFDLFGTLVFFRRASLGAATGQGMPHPRLATAIEVELPGVSAEEFVAHLRHVSRELEEARRETHREFSSLERFRRVLRRLGLDDEARVARLCAAHMAGIAASTEMPASHRGILRRLRQRYRVGLVSNFDHGPTARAILQHHGLTPLLDPILVSDECGWRKPGGDIFALALAAVGGGPESVLFAGDTPLDDIEGAHRAGFDAAWINPSGQAFPPGIAPPCITIASIVELGQLLLGEP